ncbi:carnitine dehydratase [Bordetella genomosp. 8]|uniref:Carnitine dehydratase n=1 Tax=Bordetella genomosp. 8 TaxID=1416806 RepID=A0A1W6YL64_9BORD|nr:CoA transferase [Bordetella genomosp. 8]ARP81830.1 carnitine dehydratase [Bordetella genomosp. 8]
MKKTETAATDADMALPLAGVRVVDLTSAVVGPYCTQVLADYGADVIKVEEKSGDVIRWISGKSRTPGMSGKFMHMNRNKRSVSLDLKQPAGRDALLKLVDSADVFLHNMRSAAVARLGLDADSLLARRANLLYCGIVGFGSDGRYAGRPAYDSILQGGTALASLLAGADGEPRYVPYVVIDRTAGLMVAHALLAALFARQRDGRGRVIEVPMFESYAGLLLGEHLYGHSFDPPTDRLGDRRLLDANARPVRTRDGHVCITTNTDAQVHKLFVALGRADLAQDARFSTSLARIEHISEFFAIRAELLARRDTDEVVELLLRHDIPCMPCHTLESLLADPHLGDVGLVQPGRHPTQGAIRHIRPTVRMTGYEPSVRLPAPHIGEHTRAVLAELGYGPEQIAGLYDSGAAYTAADAPQGQEPMTTPETRK